LGKKLRGGGAARSGDLRNQNDCSVLDSRASRRKKTRGCHWVWSKEMGETIYEYLCRKLDKSSQIRVLSGPDGVWGGGGSVRGR